MAMSFSVKTTTSQEQACGDRERYGGDPCWYGNHTGAMSAYVSRSAVKFTDRLSEGKSKPMDAQWKNREMGSGLRNKQFLQKLTRARRSLRSIARCAVLSTPKMSSYA